MKKLLVLFSIFLLSACSQVADEENSNLTDEGPYSVVTTIGPLYSLTAHLVEGTDTAVENLLPSGTSVHSYQLTPSSAVLIEKADLVVINGLELELFIEDAVAEEKIVDTSQGVNAIKLEEEDHADHNEDEHEDEHGHHHGEYDPHIWLSPEYAIVQAENITAALIVLDAENASTYLKNRDALVAEIQSLDAELKQQFAQFEVGPFIVFHDAYQYFQAHFGIVAVAAFEESPGDQPSAEYLAEIVEMIEHDGVEVIFTEPQFAPKLVESLVVDYGISAFELDPLGTEVSKELYFDLMRKNVQSFEDAFYEEN